MRTSMVVKAGWVCLLLAAAVSADSEVKVYKKVGDDVVLHPGSVPGAITTILWKDGPNIAMEWEGADSIDSFRQFTERGSLNILSGEMTITGLTPEDGALYTPEINSNPARPTLLIVLSPVPTPTVNKSCDDATSSCVLTCDGDTAGAEPVTYRWKSGDVVLMHSSKEHRITKDDSSSMNEFSCVLENPVSQESSEPIPNPFATDPAGPDTPDPGKLNISTGLTVFITLLAAVLLLMLVHRWKAGMWFFQKESMPWEAGFWSQNETPPRDDAGSNGTAGWQEKEQPDEETRMA